MYLFYSYILSTKHEYFVMGKIPKWFIPSFLLHSREGENNVKC